MPWRSRARSSRGRSVSSAPRCSCSSSASSSSPRWSWPASIRKGGVRLSVVTGWLFGPGLRVIVIALLAYASIRATGLVVRRFEHEVASGSTLDALERAKRARTLGAVISKVMTVVVLGVATLMILQQFNIDITPVLTGAGIAGLAVGFGAQALVRDVISGFFLLLEDQVRVGDVAAINGTAGLVEQLNLRTIVLRDGEGTVHVFPNGAITTLANRSKDFSVLHDRPRRSRTTRIPTGSPRSWRRSGQRCRRIRSSGRSSSRRSRSTAWTRSLTGGWS